MTETTSTMGMTTAELAQVEMMGREQRQPPARVAESAFLTALFTPAHLVYQFAPEASETDMALEAEIQSKIRLDASKLGWRLFRNNVGAGKLENGSFVRWGLANDSEQVNKSIKSGDLIGLRPVVITPDMVGSVIGQFVSIECKRPGWRFSVNNPRDVAQAKWAELILLLGGHAIISTGEIL